MAVTLVRCRIDGVVFDVDGVLTDTARVHFSAWTETFNLFLRSPVGLACSESRGFDESDYRRFVDGRARLDGVRAFLASRGIALPLGQRSDPPGFDTIWAVANAKNERFVSLLGDGVRSFPDAVALATELRSRGVAVAAASASRNARAVLRSAGIDVLVDVVVDGVDAERLGLAGKPDPALFVEAARRLGVDASRAALFEDSVVGVAAGRGAGFAVVIAVDRGLRGTASSEWNGADAVVDDLGDVSIG